MDFGEILDAWDRRSGRGEKQRPPARSGTRAAGNAESTRTDRGMSPAGDAAGPLCRWLQENGIHDKDAAGGQDAADSSGRDRAAARRRRLLTRRPDAEIDLHGLTQDEAWTQLESFFTAARREGCEKVLVIHGKGNHSPGEAVLKNLVRGFIERCPFTGESGNGSPAQGGSGATWVFLKL